MTDKKKNAILDKASKMYLEYEYKNLFEYLNACKGQFQIDTKRENKKFNHLFALVDAFQNNLSDAEELCNECIKVEPKEIDYYFVLSYVFLKLREYDKVLTNTKYYLINHKNKKIGNLSHTYSKHFKCQIYSFIGTAQAEIGNYEEAVTQFLKAIKTEKENQLPYLQLVNLYLHTNEYSQAEQLIQKGIKNCNQIQELRLLEKSLEISQQSPTLNQFKFDVEFSEIDQLNPNSQDYATLTILADTYKNDKKYEKALQIYEVLLHVEPNNERLLFSLSECYLIMGHEDSAIIGFERVLALAPGHKFAQEQLDRYKKAEFVN